MAQSPGRNRGQRPEDKKLFAPEFFPDLTAATDDLCWLLGRGYGRDSALQLVGNRYRLNKRQRTAVGRLACSPDARRLRSRKSIGREELKGQALLIDGFNLLILLESARGGGLLLACRDTSYRDLAGIHGTYKRVRQTEEILLAIGRYLLAAETGTVTWIFDQPVSNSGRLKTLLREMAARAGFPWEVELAHNPDKEIAERSAGHVVVTSDGWILDRCERWFNLGKVLSEGGNVLAL